MGLRRFSSQLLCEQVVGRGLRRTSYEVNPESGLFEPEYVNIFGVPFTFLPHESAENVIPEPPKHKPAIEPVPEKAEFEISWPNVVRINHTYRPRLSLDWGALQPLELDARQTARLAELAPIVEGKPDMRNIAEIDLENLAREQRTQRIIFQTARDVYDQMQKDWKGSREFLLAQLVRLIEQFIRSDGIRIIPGLFERDDLKRRLIITLNMTKVVQHIWEAIRFENAERLEPVFDQNRPIRSTGDMRTWHTGKPYGEAKRSHINFCVYDSTWEASEASELDRAPEVAAWVKNDHLGFEVFYIYRGVVRKYRPDFLIRLVTGDMLVLEVKGQESEQDKTKRRFLAEWVWPSTRTEGSVDGPVTCRGILAMSGTFLRVMRAARLEEAWSCFRRLACATLPPGGRERSAAHPHDTARAKTPGREIRPGGRLHRRRHGPFGDCRGVWGLRFLDSVELSGVSPKERERPEDKKPLRLAGCGAGFGGGLNLKNSIKYDKLAGFFRKFILVKTDLSNRMLNH